VPRYFLDLLDERNPRTCADTRYFGGVSREMERTLLNSDIDVHLTWSAKRLPARRARRF
jgi:hypothetical protein